MHHDYLYQSGVVVGCEGPAPGLLRTSPVGSRRSRDGARLQNVLADAKYWNEIFRRGAEGSNERGSAGYDPAFILLEDSTRAQVTDAITECGEFLRRFEDRPNWNGGSFFFAFSGHGTDEGDLVLGDGELSPDELMELIAASISPNSSKRRHLGLVFDSCFSGLTLARLMVHPLHGDLISIVDGFAAALHDELAWELDSLGHGALTFTMRNPGERTR